MRVTIPTLLLLAYFSAPAVYAARERPFIDEPELSMPSSVMDEDIPGWKEGVTSLPPWPNEADLVEFRVDDPSSRFRHYIDGRHIAVGSDGAVRYTLVIDSDSGARNVSFEGLRCTPSGAFKTYAYGINGRFEQTESDWVRIHGRGYDAIHRDLHDHLLCIPRKFEPRSPRDMIRTMQTLAPHEASTGFLPE